MAEVKRYEMERCACGAEIEHVRLNYWQRRGTGEVCKDNHWHRPVSQLGHLGDGTICDEGLMRPLEPKDETKRPERWEAWDEGCKDTYVADEADAYIAALERRLRDVCDRYRELQAREVTNHDFECCIISAENFLEMVDSEQKEQ